MAELVEITRPNGKVYRPRKEPRAQLVDNADDCEPYAWIFVHGTHDMDRAWDLAQPEASRHGMVADRESAHQTWMRLAMRNGDPVYDIDPIRGTATVTFEVIE
jgi:hypothetical protein